MHTNQHSQTVGVLPLSRREKQLKRALEKRFGHQAIVAIGPAGYVKFFRSSTVSAQVKQVRHGQHMHVEVYGVWWCSNETAARTLKGRLDTMLKEVHEPAEGAGYYRMSVPSQMADVAVQLAAGEVGVVTVTSHDRERMLMHHVKQQAARPPRGF